MVPSKFYYNRGDRHLLIPDTADSNVVALGLDDKRGSSFYSPGTPCTSSLHRQLSPYPLLCTPPPTWPTRTRLDRREEHRRRRRFQRYSRPTFGPAVFLLNRLPSGFLGAP